jgi:alpha-beta hydrolase superfamily lysophospholipase
VTAAVSTVARQRAAAGRVFEPDPDVTVRGTVVLLPGRGEHAGVYQRFGRRLAFDGYVVRVLDEPSTAGLSGGVLDDPAAVRPFVLAGSDTGAVRALAIAAGGVVAFDGVLLAGVLPGAAQHAGVLPAPPRILGWDDELDARTACPVHRNRLARDTTLVRGALDARVPVELVDATRRLRPADIRVPVLVVHGSADVVAPYSGAVALAALLPYAEMATLHGGRHDVLNDAHHRTVAAHVVQWLERLRAGTPILSTV